MHESQIDCLETKKTKYRLKYRLIDLKTYHAVTFAENGTTLDLNCIAVGFMLRSKAFFTFTNSTKEVPVSLLSGNVEQSSIQVKASRNIDNKILWHMLHLIWTN